MLIHAFPETEFQNIGPQIQNTHSFFFEELVLVYQQHKGDNPKSNIDENL